MNLNSVVKFSSQMHDNHALSLIKYLPKSPFTYFAIVVITLLSVDFLQARFFRPLTILLRPFSGNSNISPSRIASTTLLLSRSSDLPTDDMSNISVDDMFDLPTDECMKIPPSIFEHKGQYYQPDARENTGLWKVYYSDRFEIMDIQRYKVFAVIINDLGRIDFEEGAQVYNPDGTKYDGRLPSYENIPEILEPRPVKPRFDFLMNGLYE